MQKTLTTIGRAEIVDFPEINLLKVHAKVDTGADSSAIWAQAALASDNSLKVTFLGEAHPLYTGEVFTYEKGSYQQVVVESSTGHRDIRYKIKLKIQVNGRTIRGTFSLAERSTKTYPILLGRKLLSSKFVVDVSSGKPLTTLEKQKSSELQKLIKETKRGSN